MKRFWLGALLWTASLLLPAQEPDINVNEKYTVEDVVVTGVDETRIWPGIRSDLRNLVGEKFDQEKINRILERLRRDFPEFHLSQQLQKGDRPEHIRVIIEFGKRRFRKLEALANRASYHSKLGWSGSLEVPIRVRSSTFSFGVASDGNRLVERFAGLRARYQNANLGTRRLHLGFLFESYHQQWSPSTLAALESPTPGDIYRTRQNFEPALTVQITPELRFSGGVSFQRFQVQYPAAHTEAANSVISTLRYDRQLEGSGDARQSLGAGYNLRAATRVLDSDWVYSRHEWDARYAVSYGKHRVGVDFTAGLVTGRAPLFERFVLGNAETLRGWNKYDIIPLGGNRVVHNSLAYRYRPFEIFYDTGAVWVAGQTAETRHSAGVGLRFEDFIMGVGFPIKDGRAEPLFFLALNLR